MSGVVNANERHTIMLDVPVTFQNTPYDRLNLRRPKVKDTRLLAAKVEKDPIGANNDFIASLAEVPPGVIDELDLIDNQKISAWLKGFMPKDDEKS